MKIMKVKKGANEGVLCKMFKTNNWEKGRGTIKMVSISIFWKKKNITIVRNEITMRNLILDKISGKEKEIKFLKVPMMIKILILKVIKAIKLIKTNKNKMRIVKKNLIITSISSNKKNHKFRIIMSKKTLKSLNIHRKMGIVKIRIKKQ